MTNHELVEAILQLAIQCDIDGRDMTAAALRAAAADLLEPHYSATTRAAMALLNQISRP
jgi:hypothetical protein